MFNLYVTYVHVRKRLFTVSKVQSLEASTTSTRLSVVNMLISVFLPIIQHFHYYVCELYIANFVCNYINVPPSCCPYRVLYRLINSAEYIYKNNMSDHGHLYINIHFKFLSILSY